MLSEYLPKQLIGTPKYIIRCHDSLTSDWFNPRLLIFRQKDIHLWWINTWKDQKLRREIGSAIPWTILFESGYSGYGTELLSVIWFFHLLHRYPKIFCTGLFIFSTFWAATLNSSIFCVDFCCILNISYFKVICY